MTDIEKLIEELKRKAKKNKIKLEEQTIKTSSKTTNENTQKSISTEATKIKEQAINLKYNSSQSQNIKNSKIRSYQKSNHNFSNQQNSSNINVSNTDTTSFYNINFNSHKYFNNSFLSNKQHKASKGINVVVKSNYSMAGRLRNGKRVSAKAVKSLSTASLDYISNHGSKDLENSEELSSLYDSNGDRLTKEEFKELKKEIYQDSELTAMRRIVISPKEDLSREDMKNLTVEIMRDFEEQTGKNLNYNFAVHTDTEHIHSHVVITGTNRDINFTKEQLQKFREISEEKTLQLTKERTLEVNKNLNLKQTKEVEL